MKYLPLAALLLIVVALSVYALKLQSEIHSLKQPLDITASQRCGVELARLQTEIKQIQRIAEEKAVEADRQRQEAALLMQMLEEQKKISRDEKARADRNEQKASQFQREALLAKNRAEENARHAMESQQHAAREMELAHQNEAMAQKTIRELQEQLKSRN